MDFVFDFSRIPFDQVVPASPNSGLSIRLGKPADLPEILEIAERAFKNHFGRYNADSQMPPGAAKDVYCEWARSSFSGWADWITVAEVRGTIAGYAVWRKASALEAKHGLDIIHYNLVAIHPRFVGRGVFAALTYEACECSEEYAKQFDCTHACKSQLRPPPSLRTRLADNRGTTFLSQMADAMTQAHYDIPFNRASLTGNELNSRPRFDDNSGHKQFKSNAQLVCHSEWGREIS